jgi:hypothetical protein
MKEGALIRISRVFRRASSRQASSRRPPAA